MHALRQIAVALVCVLVTAGAAHAQDAPAPAVPLIAGADYAPGAPTVRQVLGWDSGERVTHAADVHRYFDALAQAAPDRVRIGEYGRTHEGRSLFWAAVGTPANIARLEAIKATSRDLADPRRLTEAQARAAVADQPVIVWLAYSVHGNETSPADAAMAAAYHLLASRDPAVAGWLANTVVVFVPTQNPDGRERALAAFDAGLGTQANPDPLAVERDGPWPSGRFNHDLFDLNRDWFIQSQPETEGHAALIRDWRPQVVVDAHEMGTDETFFFPPEAQPLNPWIAPATLESREIFGRNTARRFDENGVAYFNRQVYDAFYPGYGDGWPGYLGAVSMTYEQAGVGGLTARRSSGELLTYREAVRHHLIASLATIEAASANHDRLLNNARTYGADGLSGRGAFVFSTPAWDAGAADRLAALLTKSGIEVGRASAGFIACGKAWPAGSYVVNLSQPQRRMAEVLMTRDVPVPADFLAEQERRRARGLGDEIYDVTAWSLPLSFNVPTERCAAAPAVATETVTEGGTTQRSVTNLEARYGYLVAPGLAGARLRAAALSAGVTMRSADKPFTLDARRWPAGTLVVSRAGNDADLPMRMQGWARDFGAEVVGLDSSWVSDGPSLGSSDAVLLRAPRVALAWDTPTSAPAAGATRYVLERQLGYPVTVVRTATLAEADIARFDVIVLPDAGNYRGVFGSEGVASLERWVSNGGVLITLGRATRLAADPSSNLLASRRERAAGAEDAAASDKATVDGSLIADEAAYRGTLAEGQTGLANVAGALARADVDPDHWLGAGLAPHLNVLVQGSDIYTPLKTGEGVNVVRLASADDLLVSGQMWAENRRQLAFKPAVMAADHGRGWVIAFAQDPTFRGYMEGLTPLFANAVFLAPAHVSR